MAREVAGALERLQRATERGRRRARVRPPARPAGRCASANTAGGSAALRPPGCATRFHDLRHTFGTPMAAAGVPMRTLQEWMGHRDITTTLRYADYAPSGREADMVARRSPAAARSRRGNNRADQSERISEGTERTS